MEDDRDEAVPSRSEVYHLNLLERDEDPKTELVTYVAALKGVEHDTLRPLYTWADHLLDELYSTPPSAGAQALVEFNYEGFRVTLYQDGHAVLMRRSTSE